jgi:DNA-directed RNA polymerase subunit E'/Rpb7
VYQIIIFHHFHGEIIYCVVENCKMKIGIITEFQKVDNFDLELLINF